MIWRGCTPPVSSEIEIVVKVKDQAAAGLQAIRAEVKAEGEAAAAEADKAGGKIGENLASGLTRDSQGKLRNAMGRFASDAEKEAAGLGGIKIPIEAPKDDFEAGFRKAMEEGQQVADKASAEMRRSFTAVESGSRSLRAAMADLEPAAHGAGAGLDDAARRAEYAGRSAGDAGGGFSLGASRMQMMAGSAFMLAPALAALPAIGGAVIAGAATMALGFGGVIKALKDYSAQSQSTGQTGAQLAATEFSNAVAIKNAQQAIVDAKKQAARGVQDSAEQIANAEQGVGDAERQAATAAQASADQIASAQRGVESSAYSLAQAEQRLQDAEESELDAQKALTQAREDAANQLKDLTNSAADSHLAVERATLNVTKAQDNLSKTIGSSLSTDAQKKDAQLALAEAQQALTDAKQKDFEATQKADEANKAGIDGMQGVVQAQDAVAKGALGVKDAQHGVADATQAQALAQQALQRAVQAASAQQVSSNESVAKAEQSLADAQRSASRQQHDSAEAVAKAEQNLADTYKQQQLAAAAAASAGGAAANQFAKDMANLTPQAQAFVKQLLSMKSGAKELSNTAQTAMMPGLTTMLKDSGPMLPIFNKAIGDMGTVIGGTAIQFGNLMQNHAFQGQLAKVLGDGAGLAKNFGDGMVGMTSGVVQAASQAGPIVSGLGIGIKTLMTSGIPEFFSGLTTNAAGIGTAFQGVLTLVSNLGGPLGTVAGAMAASLAPAVQVLASPGVQQSLQSVSLSLAKIVTALTPLITLFAQGLANGLKTAATQLGYLAKILDDNRGSISELTKILGAAITVFNLLNLPIQLVGLLLRGLAAASDWAKDHFAALKAFVQRMWVDIKAWFMDGVHGVEAAYDKVVSAGASAWGKVQSGAKSAWNLIHDYIVNPLKTAYDFVSGKFGDLVSIVTGLPGKLATGTSHLWDWLGAGMKAAVNGVVSGMNWVIDKINGMTGGLSDTWSWAGIPRIGQIDHIPKMASGGALGLGGLAAIIGERGTEIAKLPDGTQIMPHANTQSALAQGGRFDGGASSVQIEWVGGSGGDEFLTWLRKNIRILHGSDPKSVQKALGQTF